MRAPNRARLAIGFSFAIHSGLAVTLYLLSPAVSTRAEVTALGIDTRVGRPRAAHLSLWEESSPRPSSAPARTVKPLDLPRPASLAPAISPTVAAKPNIPSFPAAGAASQASDLAVLTNTKPSISSTGSTFEPRGASSNGGADGFGGAGHDSRSTLRVSGFLRVGKQVQSVVFVIDGSQSMGLDGLFESAKRELVASIDALPEATRFQVIVYNRSAGPLRINGHTDLVLATAVNKLAAAELIRRLDPEGSTDHVRALKQAMSLQPEMILFVTDADGLRGDQVHALTVLNHGRAAINTIELNGSRRKGQSPLQILAEQNHGDFRTARAIDK